MGIYIVMVGEVFGTFLRFFIFCFSFFLLAFGFTFYVLMENQVVYFVDTLTHKFSSFLYF